ncbi:ParB/RepB/Spo0J family partition protein [Infirmifilum sp. SLHALR2]
MSVEVAYVPLERLEFSEEYNARRIVPEEEVEKLKENIRLNGLLQPLVVTPPEEGGEKLYVVCGRLRLEALRRLSQEDPQAFQKLFPSGVPVIVRRMTRREALLLSLSENIRRGSMGRDEIGEVVTLLEERFGLSRDEVQRRLQLAALELDHILHVYRALRQPMPTSVKPGRPPREGRPESSKTAKAVLRLTVRRLAMRGLVKNEKDAIKRLDELAKGLSIAESRILAQRIRQEPRILTNENKLRRVVEEIRAQELHGPHRLSAGRHHRARREARQEAGEALRRSGERAPGEGAEPDGRVKMPKKGEHEPSGVRSSHF